MALWKYVTRDNKKGTTKVFLPTPKETEKGDEAVKQALSELRTKSRGNYNSYTPRKRAQIGQYAAENGPTRAAAHFSSLWKLNINELTARRLKSEYLQKFCQASDQAKKDRKSVTHNICKSIKSVIYNPGLKNLNLTVHIDNLLCMLL